MLVGEKQLAGWCIVFYTSQFSDRDSLAHVKKKVKKTNCMTLVTKQERKSHVLEIAWARKSSPKAAKGYLLSCGRILLVFEMS